MKKPIRFAALVAALACVAATFVQSKNPDDVLKAISDLRTQRATEARAAGRQVDFAALNADIEKIAKEAVEGVEPDKVPEAQAYSWAQIFSLAGKHKETCDLCVRFVASNPPAQQKFDAQLLMLNSCNSLGEGDMIASVLPEVSAPSLAASHSLLRSVVNAYAGTISEDMGVEAAMRAIDAALAQVQFEVPRDYAMRMYDARKAAAPKNADGTPMSNKQIMASLITSGNTVNDSLPYIAADKKSSLLKEAGRNDEALGVLKEFVKGRDPASAYARRAKAAITQSEMIGSPAVPLVFGRQHGAFESLESWKGKVVIIDFTAHW